MNDLRDPYPVHISEKHMYRVPNMLEEWGDSDRIINLGAWNRGPKPDNMFTVDIERILELDGVGTIIPYDEEYFRYCICIGVLEHVKEPHVFVDEIWRILQPGGQIYVEVPFLTPYNPTHPDYFRFTPSGLKYLFREFTIDDFGLANGPGSSVYWIYRIYEALRFDRDGTVDDLLTKVGSANYTEAIKIFGMAYEHLKETDEDLSDREHAATIACSYYLLATKGE